MRLAALALVVAAFALSIGGYSRLPERVPIHWSLNGEVDNYASKAVGAFLTPAVMLILLGVFAALPAISPRGFDIERRSRAYQAICAAVLLLMLGIHVHLFLLATSVSKSYSSGYFSLLIGAIFVVLGNYLPKVPRNFFVGIRTPWTLADQDVWFRTHRVGGVVFFICGVLLMVVGPFLPQRASSVFPAALIGLAALSLVIYSYVVYRRLHAGLNKGEPSS